MDSGFKIGDIVEVITDHISGTGYIVRGDTGTVCDFSNSYYPGVRWDKKFPEGHDCRGHCDKGHGRYVFPREITLREDASEDVEDINEDSFLQLLTI